MTDYGIWAGVATGLGILIWGIISIYRDSNPIKKVINKGPIKKRPIKKPVKLPIKGKPPIKKTN